MNVAYIGRARIASNVGYRSHIAVRCATLQYTAKRCYSSSPAGNQLTGVTDNEINGARNYCLELVRYAEQVQQELRTQADFDTSKYDAASYTLRPFIPAQAQDAYLALRALNIDVARIADIASNPFVGQMRMQFWRDTVARALAFTPPKEPVALLLASAAASLSARTNQRARLSKPWLNRLITTREQYLSNPPYPDLAALEAYSENTYSTLMYLTLSALPLTSITADHIASHIGKAQGITAVLRGLPLMAFPPQPKTHSPQNALGGALAGGHQGSVPLPLDIMAEAGVREEDVMRKGSEAKGLRDAVFVVATRANDHLITARQMLSNVQKGQDVDHEFEHKDDMEHARGRESVPPPALSAQAAEVERAFGVFMPAISTQMWLDRLQKVDFDIFDRSLMTVGGDWKLPWKAYWSYSRKTL